MGKNSPPESPGPRPLIYYGQSMRPFFRDGDEILLETSAAFSRGDVVIFTPPGENRHIVHRISAAGAGGIRTRGDNAGADDPWLLKQENILGKAVFLRREGKVIRVKNGRAGRILSLFVRAVRPMRLALVKAFSVLLGKIARPGIFLKFLPESCRPQILGYRRPEGIELILTVNGRVLGKKPPGASWTIRKRALFFIDPEKLP